MNKPIDQNGRLFGIISILDVMVILLVALLAVIVFFKQDALTPTTNDAQVGTTVTYTVLCRNLQDELADSIVVGDPVFDKDQVTNGSIGTVIAVEKTTALRATSLTDGTVCQIAAPGYSDVVVTIQGVCDVVQGHYRFNDVYELGVNANRSFHTPFVSFTSLVTSIGS